MTIRVGVFGAGGRMGAAVCRAVSAADGMDLVGAVDPSHDGIAVAEVVPGVSSNVMIAGSTAGMGEVDVVVDFTVYPASLDNLRWAAETGVHAVVGTTGFSDDDLETFRSSFTSSNCLIAPNFAIGAVLMMRFAELAAPHFEAAEVLEYHHDNKIDAPSGTAMRTVERMAAASSEWIDDPTTKHVVPGARGGRGPGDIPVHSIRMRGMIAHQEVILGTTGQTLTIRHDSYDRESFMPGVVLGVRRIADFPGVTVGLDPLLGL